MKIVDYLKVPAMAPMPGVSKRVPIGPEEGAPNFITRVFEISQNRSRSRRRAVVSMEGAP